MAEKRRRIVTPEQLKRGWLEYKPGYIPNVIHREYVNAVPTPDGNYMVDDPVKAGDKRGAGEGKNEN